MVDLKAACAKVRKIDPLCYKGKVKNIVGMMMETTGLDAKIGDICRIGGQSGKPCVEAEAVGFRDGDRKSVV